jgi:hypothetical protein
VLRLNVRPQDLLGGRLVAAEVAHGSTVIVTVVLQPGVLILESSKPPSSRGWGGGGIIRSYLGGKLFKKTGGKDGKWGKKGKTDKQCKLGQSTRNLRKWFVKLEGKKF